MSDESKSRSPGRPRLHEIGQWTTVQFRLPIELRKVLLQLLAQRNGKLAYRLSLNSLLLELIETGLKAEVVPVTVESSEEHSKKILQSTPSSLQSK